MTNSLAIKNLAIALEALSRIKGAEEEYESVNSLLLNEIMNAHKENHPLQSTTTDDDIPF